MSSFYASDFLREFELRLILGSPAAVAPWQPTAWTGFVEALEPLVEATAQHAAAGGSYLLPAGPKWKVIPFRCRAWQDLPPSRGTFASWSLFAPTERTCAAGRRAPELYVTIWNDRAVAMLDLPYNARLLVALSADIENAVALLDPAIERLRAITSPLLIARKRRTWGLPTELGYNQGISETNWVAGAVGRRISREMLDEEWDEVTTTT